VVTVGKAEGREGQVLSTPLVKRPSTARRPSTLPRSLDELPEHFTEKPMQEPTEQQKQMYEQGKEIAQEFIDLCKDRRTPPTVACFAIAEFFAAILCNFIEEPENRELTFDSWVKLTKDLVKDRALQYESLKGKAN
jgi:hypothetical protein